MKTTKKILEHVGYNILGAFMIFQGLFGVGLYFFFHLAASFIMWEILSVDWWGLRMFAFFGFTIFLWYYIDVGHK